MREFLPLTSQVSKKNPEEAIPGICLFLGSEEGGKQTRPKQCGTRVLHLPYEDVVIYPLSCLRQTKRGAFLAHNLKPTWSKVSWRPQWCPHRSRLQVKGTAVVPGHMQFKRRYLWLEALYLSNLYRLPKCLDFDCAKTRHLRDTIRTGATYAVIFPWYFPSVPQFKARGLSEPDIIFNIAQQIFVL